MNLIPSTRTLGQASTLALFLFIGACSEGGGSQSDAGQDGDYPDHTRVYEATGHTETMADDPFRQERATLYRTTDRLPNLDVRCLAVIDGAVWAGSSGDLYLFDPDQDIFEAVALPDTSGVIDLARSSLDDGRIVLAQAGQVVLRDQANDANQIVPASFTLSSVATDGNSIWAGSDQGLLHMESGEMTAVPSGPTEEIFDLAVDDSGTLWLASSSGLLAFDGNTTVSHRSDDGSLPDDDVRAVVALPGGGVLAGCATGAALVGTATDKVISAGKGSLPYDDLTALAVSDGAWFLGHGIGATWVGEGFKHTDYYHSLRWIPGQAVTAVALEDEHRRWVGTPEGIGRIDLVETTLAQKAQLMESYNDGFWRLDFVSDDGRRDDPWDLSQPIQHHDHDNDGLWTQMQIVAWSYAAAATGDQTFCHKARRAMGAMQWQIDIPAADFAAAGLGRGFVTRSFVRDDEGQVFDSKATQDNWHLVQGWSDGHDYYWKDDTSSDETTGHFFGYPVFFDFCATDPVERQELADHAGDLARYIIEHDFELIDLDGQKTTHGHWNPQRLAVALDGLGPCMEEHDMDLCIEARYGGGWLNAIEILGHLLAAWHMTGDPLFYDAYDSLIEDHRYGELVDFNEEIFTVTKRATANHSDHELAMLAYHTLIRYEPNPDRRERWIRSLLDMYEWEKAERNPAWSAFIAGFQPSGYELEDAVGTLREWSEDWREWRVDNSHRKDVTPDVADRHGDAQFKETLPYDEIRTLKWNTNPYAVAGGGDGRSVQAPWPWLMPYWIYRYHGVIQ